MRHSVNHVPADFHPEAADQSQAPQPNGDGYEVVVQPGSPAAETLASRSGLNNLFVGGSRGPLGERESNSPIQYRDVWHEEKSL